MIVGLSLILAFLSYLLYRRLFSSDGTSSGQSKTLPMWPFFSAFIKQPPNPKPPSSPQAQATTPTAATALITVQDYDAPNFEPALKEKDTQQQQLQTQISAQAPPPPSSPLSSPRRTPSPPDLHSPEATPKALAPSAAPSVRISAIPGISLLADGGRGGDDSGARGVGGSNHSSGGQAEEDETDDDIPPSFPSLNSVQRASGGIPSLTAPLLSSASPPPLPSLSPSTNTNRIPSPVTSTAAPTLPMAPPPIPIRGRNPKANARLIVPGAPSQTSAAQQQRQSASSAARSRLAAVGLGASGVAAGNGLTLPSQRKSATSSSSRKKVILEPGHSPLDWARLQRSGVDLRNLPHSNLIKVSPSMLATHAKHPDDIWTALNGRVYNITAYLPFHPGGERDLLRGAGKDCTKLFNATHPWVNVEGMLAECLIGIYITEEEAAALAAPESSLESVD
ncbi:unnamed protein product [Tuber aestivum]|uniref:Cytochrome b5 heme-binding domain-containing protein n=1 Tax=Tuber aestivum TaxID=59557 RepID=A0A292PXZ8_9PEZI|nr:unnamed protein product [Tuber aestivum]